MLPAGLRLAPGGTQLTRTWIVYNKPKEPSYTHAGMLMGLGLTGPHLASKSYVILDQGNQPTSIQLRAWPPSCSPQFLNASWTQGFVQ